MPERQGFTVIWVDDRQLKQHVCGAVNAALTLTDRSWTCKCGVVHERDFNVSQHQSRSAEASGRGMQGQ
jgi:hypothetical protein